MYIAFFLPPIIAAVVHCQACVFHVNAFQFEGLSCFALSTFFMYNVPGDT